MENSENDEIEKRMRPGMLSEEGFLGHGESLEIVLIKDAQTVNRHGLTHEKLADRLEYFLLHGLEKYLDTNNPIEVDGTHIVDIIHYAGMQECPWGDAGRIYEMISCFSCKKSIERFDGWDKCPYCGAINRTPRTRSYLPTNSPCDKYSSLDVVVTNKETGKTIEYPGLIIHLIRKHNFYEGKQSKYRVDPERIVEILGF